jgi:hypothetical protein
VVSDRGHPSIPEDDMRVTPLHRFLTYPVAAMIAVAAATTVAPQPAAAACYGCEGYDPNTNGCSNAQNVAEFTTSSTAIRIELRYSTACGGVWTRSTQRKDRYYGTDIFVQDLHTGNFFRTALTGQSQQWTRMFNIDRTVRACYGYGKNGPGWNQYDIFECTGWY